MDQEFRGLLQGMRHPSLNIDALLYGASMFALLPVPDARIREEPFIRKRATNAQIMDLGGTIGYLCERQMN